MPQLNPEFFTPQLFWLLVTFTVLFVFLAKSVLPRITSVLEERELRIGSDLDKAQALRDEAEKVLAAYEESLAQSRAKAAQIAAETRASLQEAADARKAEVDAELMAKIAVAEKRIATAKEDALANLQSVSVEACQDVVAKLINVDLDEASVKAAVAAEAASIAKGAA